MPLARRTIEKQLLAATALELVKSNVVSHCFGAVTVSKEGLDLSAVLEAVQSFGFTPVVLKVGSHLGKQYVTFATSETVAQSGQGSHNPSRDSMDSDTRALFANGGMSAEQIAETFPAAAPAAPRRNRRGNNRSNPVAR